MFNDIYNDITSSFGSLWKVKQRGKTLEIITPFATTNHSFISVFLSLQNNEYVVSDGGWISSGIYENIFNIEDEHFYKAFLHYKSNLHIRELKHSGQIYFYKKSSSTISIPSLVFDMAHFISAVLSLTYVEFTEVEEKEAKKRFQSKANSYLESIIEGEKKISLNGTLSDKPKIRYSAVISGQNNKVVLLNYITGSSHFYFSNSISKTNMIFEMAQDSSYSKYVTKKISLIDDSATGYDQNKLAPYINHLVNHTESVEVTWSEKGKLSELINI